MEGPEPENGLVIRYDFLWKREDEQGQRYGVKDRPCVIVLVSEPEEHGGWQVVVCPITHTPPEDRSSAVEVPAKVAVHLELDGQRSWIRTHEVNIFTWEKGRIPFGLTPVAKDNWTFGVVPPKLYSQMRDQVLTLRQKHFLKVVPRD